MKKSFLVFFLLCTLVSACTVDGSGVDFVPPDTTITSGPEGTISNVDVTFGFACNEEACSFVCQMDDAAVQACHSPTTYSGLADGAHLFAVTAIDAALNEDPSPATRAFTVATTAPDVTPPNTTILSGPQGTIHNADVSFSFACDEGTCTYECKRDDGNYLTCVSPNSWTALADGAHSFEVRATDKAGNTDASPARRDFVVDTSVPDTTPPETTIDSGPAGVTSVTDVTFTFSCDEGSCTFECRMGSSAWSPCSSPKSMAGLTSGDYSFEVKAKDNSNNTDLSPAIWHWSIRISPEAIVAGTINLTNMIVGSTAPEFDGVLGGPTTTITGDFPNGGVVLAIQGSYRSALITDVTIGAGKALQILVAVTRLDTQMAIYNVSGGIGAVLVIARDTSYSNSKNLHDLFVRGPIQIPGGGIAVRAGASTGSQIVVFPDPFTTAIDVGSGTVSFEGGSSLNPVPPVYLSVHGETTPPLP